MGDMTNLWVDGYHWHRNEKGAWRVQPNYVASPVPQPSPSPREVALLDEIERLRAEVDRLTGEKEELRALISSCDSGQTALTCHLKLRLIRDAMRAVCTQRRDCMAIDHDYPCPIGGRP